MSKITVVTPCYNARPFIANTVASVQAQDLSDWNYVLVDDGSVDGTAELLHQLAKNDPRIAVVTQPNGGTCRARNLGAERGSPDSVYLLFLDHDDMLEPNALRVLSEYLDAHPDVGIAACQFREINAKGDAESSRTRSRWVPSLLGIPRTLRPDEPDTPFVTFYCGTGQGPFAMFRRSIFEQVGGWTTEFWPHEDTDLFCKMALLAKVHYLPDRLYRKRAHAGNALNDTDRVMTAYGLFREKWDHFQPRSAAEGDTLRSAARFYRASFRPLRHVKVGMKATGEFLRSRDPAKARWAFSLFRSALRDAVRYRFGSS